MSTQESCKTCRFWNQTYDRGVLPDGTYFETGVCRRRSPSIPSGMNREHPRTDPMYWCGEYEAPAPEATGPRPDDPELHQVVVIKGGPYSGPHVTEPGVVTRVDYGPTRVTGTSVMVHHLGDRDPFVCHFREIGWLKPLRPDAPWAEPVP